MDCPAMDCPVLGSPLGSGPEPLKFSPDGESFATSWP